MLTDVQVKMAEENSNRRKSFLSDCQLKELIQTENLSRKRWLQKWAFLDQEKERKVYREEAIKLQVDPEFLFKRKNVMKYDKELKVEIAPSPPPPRTMSQLVGWRSGPEHSLEICGPLYISSKQELAKEDVKSYRTVFLG